MSDPVLIAIIVAIQGAAVAWFNNRKGKEREARTTAKIEETKAVVEGQKEAIATLEHDTNSIKDELVKVTAKEQRAIGHLEGRAEMKVEQRQLEIDEEGVG